MKYVADTDWVEGLWRVPGPVLLLDRLRGGDNRNASGLKHTRNNVPMLRHRTRVSTSGCRFREQADGDEETWRHWQYLARLMPVIETDIGTNLDQERYARDVLLSRSKLSNDILY